MSQSDFVGEFLELHRRHKTGDLTAAEAQRWQALKESLNRAPDAIPAADPASLEWDPEIEPHAA